MTISGTDEDHIHKVFQRDGFIGPIDVISTEEAHEALIEVQNELSHADCSNNNNNSIDSSRFKLHLILPTISKIAHNPKLITAVKVALNTNDILLWSSDINTKRPASSGFYAPHQDCTYAGLSPSSSVLTAWIALSHPVGEREGCLEFYPGSHTVRHPHRTTETDTTNTTNTTADNSNNLLVMGQYIDKEAMATLNQPTSVELKGGQATLHSFDCVHASSPNRSNHPRVGLALRYMASTVRQTKPVREMATWICGERSERYFDLEPMLPEDPAMEDVERGREVQKDGLAREECNYFDRGREAQRESLKRFRDNYCASND